MRQFLATALHRLARWLHPKAAPFVLTGTQWSGTHYVDAYQRNRQPSPNELLAELKGTAWTCASINASVCANFSPRLYVATHPGQSAPKCLTRPIAAALDQRLRALGTLPPRFTKAAQIEEVLDHPLLTLLQQVNPVHNSFNVCTITRLALPFDQLGTAARSSTSRA